MGDVLALWLVHWTRGQEVWGLKPVWVIVWCSWAKLYIFTVSVSWGGLELNSGGNGNNPGYFIVWKLR